MRQNFFVILLVAIISFNINILSALEFNFFIQTEIIYYTQAIRKNPNDVDAIYNLANLKMISDEYEEAIENYNKVISLIPNYKNSVKYLYRAKYNKDNSTNNIRTVSPFKNAKEMSDYMKANKLQQVSGNVGDTSFNRDLSNATTAAKERGVKSADQNRLNINDVNEAKEMNALGGTARNNEIQASNYTENKMSKRFQNAKEMSDYMKAQKLQRISGNVGDVPLNQGAIDATTAANERGVKSADQNWLNINDANEAKEINARAGTSRNNEIQAQRDFSNSIGGVTDTGNMRTQVTAAFIPTPQIYVEPKYSYVPETKHNKLNTIINEEKQTKDQELTKREIKAFVIGDCVKYINLKNKVNSEVTLVGISQSNNDKYLVKFGTNIYGNKKTLIFEKGDEIWVDIRELFECF